MRERLFYVLNGKGVARVTVYWRISKFFNFSNFSLSNFGKLRSVLIITTAFPNGTELWFAQPQHKINNIQLPQQPQVLPVAVVQSRYAVYDKPLIEDFAHGSSMLRSSWVCFPSSLSLSVSPHLLLTYTTPHYTLLHLFSTHLLTPLLSVIFTLVNESRIDSLLGSLCCWLSSWWCCNPCILHWVHSSSCSEGFGMSPLLTSLLPIYLSHLSPFTLSPDYPSPFLHHSNIN